MNLNYKGEVKVWSIYFLTLFLAIYAHELGHCIPAWISGIKAIPTPAKEYILADIPSNKIQIIALGGIIGTILFTITVFILYLSNNLKYGSSILAGSIAMPAMYTLRFFIVGRGHDATEFQEAQSALGLNYSGHSLDWFLFAVFLIGVAIWIIKSKLSFKLIGRLLIGAVLTIIFVIGLQVINNAIFDPLFQP